MAGTRKFAATAIVGAPSTVAQAEVLVGAPVSFTS